MAANMEKFEDLVNKEASLLESSLNSRVNNRNLSGSGIHPSSSTRAALASAIRRKSRSLSSDSLCPPVSHQDSPVYTESLKPIREPSPLLEHASSPLLDNQGLLENNFREIMDNSCSQEVPSLHQDNSRHSFNDHNSSQGIFEANNVLMENSNPGFLGGDNSSSSYPLPVEENQNSLQSSTFNTIGPSFDDFDAIDNDNALLPSTVNNSTLPLTEAIGPVGKLSKRKSDLNFQLFSEIMNEPKKRKSVIFKAPLYASVQF